MNNSDKLVQWLFKSGAFKVSTPDKPFWYTSGTIGPYYINTHYLFGGEKKSSEFLKLIDEAKDDIMTCSERLLNKELEEYNGDQIYNGVIEFLVSYISSSFSVSEIDYISGGERRDWYFSLLPAHILKIPHLTIFKDSEAVIFNAGKTEKAVNIEGANVLHIADIITEASSFIRSWIPAVQSLGGSLTRSLVIIDRMQGGSENLKAAGTELHSLINVDKSLFDAARANSLLDDAQYKMLMEYAKDPRGSMRQFLIGHNTFLDESLKADEKTASRARMCIENDFYGLR